MGAVCGLLADKDDPTVAAETVARMLAALHGYGPTETVAQPVPGLHLGHRQSFFFHKDALEQQPVVGGGGRLVLVADLHLSNAEALRAALGIRAGSISHSNLLLRAFETWGQDCVQRLRGDFAFALWDDAAATLYCARDHFGTRPFYYAWRDGVFAFASSIKAVLQLRSLPRGLNDEAVARYLFGLKDLDGATFFADVNRLPPGHALAVTRGGSLRVHRYHAFEEFEPIVLRTPADYLRRVREQIASAVAARLETPHGVGVRLSGGLDSSAIACVAARALAPSGRRLTALSSVLPADHEGRERDERAYINAVLDQGANIDWEPIIAPEASPVTQLEQEFECFFEPCWVNYSYIDAAIAKRAAERGVGVLFDGYPGDATVSYTSVTYFTDLALRLRWSALWREMTLLSRAHGYRRRKLLRLILVRMFGRDRKRLLAALKGTSTVAGCERSAIRPEFADRLGLQWLGSSYWQPPLRQRLFFRPHHLWQVDRVGFGPSNDYIAHSSARFGVYWCSPFADVDLIETCLSAPAEAMHRGGYGRRLLRDSMDGILPPLVQWRTSKGAGGPDYHRRLLNNRETLVRDIERLRSNPWLAERLDYNKMLAVLADIETCDGLEGRWDARAHTVLTTGYRLARFVEWLDGGPADRVRAPAPNLAA